MDIEARIAVKDGNVEKKPLESRGQNDEIARDNGTSDELDMVFHGFFM